MSWIQIYIQIIDGWCHHLADICCEIRPTGLFWKQSKRNSSFRVNKLNAINGQCYTRYTITQLQLYVLLKINFLLLLLGMSFYKFLSFSEFFTCFCFCLSHVKRVTLFGRESGVISTRRKFRIILLFNTVFIYYQYKFNYIIM